MTSVLARTPLRLSMGGGGTDLPSYARRYGGLVVGFAIDRAVSVAVHPHSFTGEVRACLERTEVVARPGDLTDPFARSVLASLPLAAGLQVASFGDAPSGSGLGSSAAFTVSLLHALRSSRTPEEPVDPMELAEDAAAIEMWHLRRPVGKQDHYLASLGGARVLHIDRSLRVEVEPLTLSAAMTQFVADRMMLFHTGRTRDAGRVLAAQVRKTEQRDRATIAALHDIREIASAMVGALVEDDTEQIGALLDAHWAAKKELSGGVSTVTVDKLYRSGMEAGSAGGKLLGAGGGGFLLLTSRPGRQAHIRAAMAAAGAEELSFAFSPLGSRAVAIS